MDYHLPHADALQLTYRIKQEIPAPKVLISSAYAGTDLAVAGLLARADGLLSKGIEARELFEAIRRVKRGERLLGDVGPSVLREASARIAEPDAPCSACCSTAL